MHDHLFCTRGSVEGKTSTLFLLVKLVIPNNGTPELVTSFGIHEQNTHTKQMGSLRSLKSSRAIAFNRQSVSHNSTHI